MDAHYFVDFCFHSLLGGGVGWRGGGGRGGFFYKLVAVGSTSGRLSIDELFQLSS